MMRRLPGDFFLIKLFYFFELFPFAKLAIEICNSDISKIVIARSFKFGQLIQVGELYS